MAVPYLNQTVSLSLSPSFSFNLNNRQINELSYFISFKKEFKLSLFQIVSSIQYILLLLLLLLLNLVVSFFFLIFFLNFMFIYYILILIDVNTSEFKSTAAFLFYFVLFEHSILNLTISATRNFFQTIMNTNIQKKNN